MHGLISPTKDSLILDFHLTLKDQSKKMTHANHY